MLTEQAWIDRCSKRYIERGGCSEENARQLATAAFEHRDGDESPEDAADTEMSHWAEDR
ncbi:hypothetical protein LGM58_08400 [Burkholderia contaminans]|uniref:hypothetical protein n=1 Tax=Burkholderia contaminans TaxID=488447 RepID=UPI001CF3B858|nr:hypothetical protein [Burkholderia contaminans]MCA7883205.1 hypothetical protein [Burkholderia contaminans]